MSGRRDVGHASRVTARFAFLDAPTPLAFAHRGAAADAPDGVAGAENSMAAFERAIRLGYRYLETDVRVSRDGVAVLFHDATVRRVTGAPGRIAELSWLELSRLRVAGREAIPRLDDLLASWPEVRLNLDLKVDTAVDALVTAVRRAGAADRVCVGSFSDARLARARAALGPRTATSLGPREAFALRLAAWSGPAARSVPVPAVAACAQVPPRVRRLPVVDRRFVDAAHRRGLQVHVWTVDDPAEMRRLLDLGVDGLMTDRATALRDVLADRGGWTGR